MAIVLYSTMKIDVNHKAEPEKSCNLLSKSLMKG